MEKEKYTAPEMEIVKFETEDVITTSGIDGKPSTDEGEGSIVQ